MDTETFDLCASSEKDTISCYLMGGLGNQLFQIFTTFAYGLRHNREVVLPYTDVLTTGILRPTYWNTFLKPLKDYTTLNNKFFTNNDFSLFPVYREPFHHYHPIPISSDPKILLYGYYQSYKFFDNEKEQIFSLIDLETQQKKTKTEYSHYFDENSNTISMHFRLGDYKEKQDYHPILPYDYYENAIFNILIYSKYTKPYKVLYFCEQEDNDIVDTHIKKLRVRYNAMEFVKVDDTIEDWKQMLIMSCCNHNIIANSSFSWWGGYFNQNPNKIVCYPNVWFGPSANHDISDMFPITWNYIKWTE
jgi:hypothetical protein